VIDRRMDDAIGDTLVAITESHRSENDTTAHLLDPS
jgi:hypothetical protein